MNPKFEDLKPGTLLLVNEVYGGNGSPVLFLGYEPAPAKLIHPENRVMLFLFEGKKISMEFHETNIGALFEIVKEE